MGWVVRGIDGAAIARAAVVRGVDGVVGLAVAVVLFVGERNWGN